MTVRSSVATWDGTIREGSGRMTIGRDVSERPYTFASRFDTGAGSNPEELIAAAHAGCFSMALSGRLTRANFPPKRIHTTAKVHLEVTPAGHEIKLIELDCEVEVAGISEAEFQEAAEGAKANCPVSKALKAVEIKLKANLISPDAASI